MRRCEIDGTLGSRDFGGGARGQGSEGAVRSRFEGSIGESGGELERQIAEGYMACPPPR